VDKEVLEQKAPFELSVLQSELPLVGNQGMMLPDEVKNVLEVD
jgi:hypothetical protein